MMFKPGDEVWFWRWGEGFLHDEVVKIVDGITAKLVEHRYAPIAILGRTLQEAKENVIARELAKKQDEMVELAVRMEEEVRIAEVMRR